MLLLAIMLAVVAPAAASAPLPATPPPAVMKDSPEEIAKDAARDLADSHFYNKPGATRADYDAAWQACRLIARGSRTPTGTYVVVYNPAVISPAAAAVGGGIGAAIGAAIAEGIQRRANRMSCLMVRGWRRVEVEDAERLRVAALGEAERNDWFATLVGAPEVKGRKVAIWNNDFAAPVLAPESEQ